MFGSAHSQRDYDAVIVGARCAGAATAMLLARAGARVLVVERGRYGDDTLSTHALMRPAVAQLQRWGLLDEIVRAGTPAVRQIMFDYESEKLVIDIRPGSGVDALYAPRRMLLERVLADAARSADAEIRFGTALDEIVRDRNGRISGARFHGPDGRQFTVQAGLVIGADGRDSMVARLVGARENARSRHRTSTVFGYFRGIADPGYRWSYRPGSSIGVIPTNGGVHCIFATVARSRAKEVFGGSATAGFLDIVARHDPELVDRLHASRLDGRLHRIVGAFGHMRKAQGPGWALVGDAGYFTDPIAAHGITDALRDAELLADAVLSGDTTAFARYQRTRDARSLPIFEVTDEIASFSWDEDQIRAHHARLHQAMKAELAHLTGRGDSYRSAA